MKILAIDLGTYAGFATGPTESFSLNLGPETSGASYHDLRRQDPRVSAFWRKLWVIPWPDLIVFEDVEFGTYLAQVQLWSSFRGALWAFAYPRKIRVECLATGKLKKYATGSGGANKAAMAKFLARKHPSVYTLEKGLVKRKDSGIFLTDDEVDALHLWAWANETLT